MNYDYAIHSDFLIHWTGKDIDENCTGCKKKWFEENNANTCKTCTNKYIERLKNTLKHGLWMTEDGDDESLIFGRRLIPQQSIKEIEEVGFDWGKISNVLIDKENKWAFKKNGKFYLKVHIEELKEKINNDLTLKNRLKSVVGKNFLSVFDILKKHDDKGKPIPTVARTCFTELKLSESREHARNYGRLGIGFKRFFVLGRFGRPVMYYVNNGWGPKYNLDNDKFLKFCVNKFQDEDEKIFLNYFKSMNSRNDELSYDLYRESEWRIIYSDISRQLSNLKRPPSNGLIIDPKDPKNTDENAYYQNLKKANKKLPKYLIPLDGWLSMIIYPNLDVKNKCQEIIRDLIKEIKRRMVKDCRLQKSTGKEENNWPIEMDLDACRNF